MPKIKIGQKKAKTYNAFAFKMDENFIYKLKSTPKLIVDQVPPSALIPV